MCKRVSIKDSKPSYRLIAYVKDTEYSYDESRKKPRITGVYYHYEGM